MKDTVGELRQMLQSEDFLSNQIQREKALITEHAALKQAEGIGEKRGEITGEKKGMKKLSTAAIKKGFISFQNALNLSQLTFDEHKEACDLEGIEISPEELKAAKEAEALNK